MQHSHHPHKRRPRRTKQTLQAPRRMERNAEQELKKLVWVTVGKTEHQAWLLESVKDKNVVSIRWETTGSEEKVQVMSIRHEAPDDGRRSRRKRITVQDSFKGLDDAASIQIPRKQKRRQTKTKATTKNKIETIETKSLGGGQVEPLGAKVESKRLAAGTLSALSDIRGGSSTDAMMPTMQAIMAERKGDPRKKKVPTSHIAKASSSGRAKAKESAISDIPENAELIAGSSNTAHSATPTFASSKKSSKAAKSTTAAPASNHDESPGFWM